ncbi:Hypothetical protein NGAL_HAMBI1145_29250 [Neorhizobium galegae bv. officinalis]|uniref:Uncharacterized protein n=1 Tax=Neorhizobium galegae bv. officinalis TaxID=323656 RepID=A0A0T7FKU6_NEOGA|nr:hypothetical protein [Neorhizobium galegae]CDZ35599.1 Hypothetical protein NGAL_HAMBI1145_29250 [Neorhizobium galegae bv. officinalis]
MPEGTYNNDHFKMGSVMTHQKAIRLMQESWQEVFGEPLVLSARQPLAQFQAALDRFTKMLARHTPDSKKLQKALKEVSSGDPVIDDLFGETLEASAQERSVAIHRDMDMVPPRVCMD